MNIEKLGNGYKKIGIEAQLDNITLIRYINYMVARWSHCEELQCASGYAEEWAYRFKHKQEYGASDSTGIHVLEMIDKEFKAELKAEEKL